MVEQTPPKFHLLNCPAPIIADYREFGKSPCIFILFFLISSRSRCFLCRFHQDSGRWRTKKIRRAYALRIFVSASLTRFHHESSCAELALTSRLGLLLALDARFLVMFTFPNFCQCAGLLAGTAASSAGTGARFVFSHFALNFQWSSPPPLDLGRTGRQAWKLPTLHRAH